MNTEPIILEGQVSIRAALEAQSRPIYELMLQADKPRRRFSRLIALAQQADIPIRHVDASTIAQYASGTTHGGAIARVGPRHFVPPLDLLPSNQAPFIAMLDGIEDPYNFGSAVRALYAAGAHGLIVRPRNWMSAAGIVARSSAGASERIPMAVCETASAAAELFRAQGLAVVCTSKEHAIPLYQADLTQPLLLVIGGEKRGITRSFLRQADIRLHIPYARPFSQSLGTASAVAVLAFEVMRQRKT